MLFSAFLTVRAGDSRARARKPCVAGNRIFGAANCDYSQRRGRAWTDLRDDSPMTGKYSHAALHFRPSAVICQKLINQTRPVHSLAPLIPADTDKKPEAVGRNGVHIRAPVCTSFSRTATQGPYHWLCLDNDGVDRSHHMVLWTGLPYRFGGTALFSASLALLPVHRISDSALV